MSHGRGYYSPKHLLPVDARLSVCFRRCTKRLQRVAKTHHRWSETLFPDVNAVSNNMGLHKEYPVSLFVSETVHCVRLKDRIFLSIGWSQDMVWAAPGREHYTMSMVMRGQARRKPQGELHVYAEEPISLTDMLPHVPLIY
jgi:hypothetical protein